MVGIALVCLFAAVLRAEDQPKKYDLKLNWKAVEGHKSELSKDESQVMFMKVSPSGDGEGFTQEDKEETSLAAIQVISKTMGDKPAIRRWTFTKATRRHGEHVVPFAFQRRTLVVTSEPEGKSHFTFDNGEAVTAEDAKVLAGFGDSDNKPGEPSGEEIFAPKQPVTVGETWTPDVAMIAQGLQFGDAIDLKRSSAKAKLKSAETRNGVEFGKIDVVVELWLTKFGAMRLDSPVVVKVGVDMDVCIDGTQPDGVMRVTAEVKGDSWGTLESNSRRARISLDMTMSVLETQKTVK